MNESSRTIGSTASTTTLTKTLVLFFCIRTMLFASRVTAWVVPAVARGPRLRTLSLLATTNNGKDTATPMEASSSNSNSNRMLQFKNHTALSTSATPTTTTTSSSFRCPSITVLAIDPRIVQIKSRSFGTTASKTGNSNSTPFPAGSLTPPPPDRIEPTVMDPKQDEEELIQRLPFVNMFRGSANYIANHRNTMAVYHIPGGLLDLPRSSDEASSSSSSTTTAQQHNPLFQDLMDDIALTWLLGMRIVLVVGCRHQLEQRLGESKHNDGSDNDDGSRSNGLRVTDPETLRIVKEEAGYVRFEVERQLARSLRMQGTGAAALGSRRRRQNAEETRSGDIDLRGYTDGNVVSGNFFSAQPFGILDGTDYQYTGFVRRIETDKIRKLHDNRDICLLTTLGVSPSGEVFNVNSESLAAATAGALQASKVIYFTEQEMELRHQEHDKKIQSLRVSDANNLLGYHGIRVHKKGFVDMDGTKSDVGPEARDMLLKIGWSVQALEQGVKRAHIISPKHGALLQELYTRDGSGTLISGDLYDGIRQACVNDVGSIHDLISPLIKMGTLIDRPKATLEKDIDSYYVFTRDDHIVACGQLKIFEQGFAEIGCLVVNQSYRSRGRGDAMLGYLERLCLQNGCSSIFVLSTQTMEWFIERDFEEVGVDRLPPSRQETYNYKRNSKIYMKQIESDRDLDASELWWNR